MLIELEGITKADAKNQLVSINPGYKADFYPNITFLMSIDLTWKVTGKR